MRPVRRAMLFAFLLPLLAGCLNTDDGGYPSAPQEPIAVDAATTTEPAESIPSDAGIPEDIHQDYTLLIGYDAPPALGLQPCVLPVSDCLEFTFQGTVPFVATATLDVATTIQDAYLYLFDEQEEIVAIGQGSTLDAIDTRFTIGPHTLEPGEYTYKIAAGGAVHVWFEATFAPPS